MSRRFFGNLRLEPPLTKGSLDELPDEELEAELFTFILDHRLPQNRRASDEEVEHLPPGLQMIYYTQILENEVLNGGFNQFFQNQPDSCQAAALRELKRIGANRLAGVMERAIAVHLKEKRPRARTLKNFADSYNHTDLNRLDLEFFAIQNELSHKRVQFIRSHPDLFI